MLECPIPLRDYPVVTLAHGGGGALMHRLIRDLFTAVFGADALQSHADSAILNLPPGRVAFTTDSFVVKPLFFPGGDIGKLAINGTVNDLAMAGADPLWLSCAMIIEEGLPMETLWRVALSMQGAAAAAGVRIVTGDTKVVDKGKGDGLFINTAGIGVVPPGADAIPVTTGDVILLNGDIARHGMAILAAREELALESPVDSDCAPLNHAVRALREGGVVVRGMRDATRGGVATVLIELARDAGLDITINETAIPVREDVRGACELLGIDPLYVANEGRFVCVVAEADAERARELLAHHFAGTVPIGQVGSGAGGRLLYRSRIGSTRLLDLLSGEQLPRIC